MSPQVVSPMLLGLLALLASSHGRADVDSLTGPHSHQWDILIFTQHWPNTVCIQWKDKSEAHACYVTENWGVHGVWPTKLGTIGPGFCNNTWHFKPTELTPIQKELDVKWPNIENGTAEDSLWKHEWQKHGTCAAQLPALNTELKYFSKGLEWLDQHSMTAILAQEGIIPDSNKAYSVQEINDAVKKHIGTNPAIECFREPKTHITYLFEIRICFSKKLGLTDCDGIVGSNGYNSYGDIITNCHADEQIIYPDKVPEADEEKPPVKYSWLIRALRLLKVLQWLTF